MSESLPRVVVSGFMAPNAQEREQHQHHHDESDQLQRGARYIRRRLDIVVSLVNWSGIIIADIRTCVHGEGK